MAVECAALDLGGMLELLLCAAGAAPDDRDEVHAWCVQRS